MALDLSLSPRGLRESMPDKSEERQCLLPSRMRLLLTVPSCHGQWGLLKQHQNKRYPISVRSPNPCTSSRMWPYVERAPTYALVASRQKDTFYFFEDLLIICISTSGGFPLSLILRGAGPHLLMQNTMLWDC